MLSSRRIKIISATLGTSLIFVSPAVLSAATIDTWNTNNVAVSENPSDGETGASIVYDRDLNTDGSIPAGATSSGQIVFTPPEAVSPGIKIDNDSYSQGGSSGITLSGCVMTSSSSSCTGDFQSGKRVKQQMTGTDPVDLVFDIDPSAGENTYQVFGRLINVTGEPLAGFEVELGFGVGADFVAATKANGLFFSEDFKARPTGSGSASTQYPFGLFGDASTNDNFHMDGFFASERTGLNVIQTDTKLKSTDYFGPYETLFGAWNNQDDVPAGLFWDFDGDLETDSLLMAWQIDEVNDVWELRRDAVENCDADGNCTYGETRDEYFQGSISEVTAMLLAKDALEGSLGEDWIEDLANLNLNYAITLGNVMFNSETMSSFTLRTTVAPVPIPAPLALFLTGLVGLGIMGRRRKKSTA